MSNNFLKSVDLFVDANFIDSIHKSSDEGKRLELPEVVVARREKWIVVGDDVSTFRLAEDSSDFHHLVVDHPNRNLKNLKVRPFHRR